MLWKLFQVTVAGAFMFFCIYAEIGDNPVSVAMVGAVLAYWATGLLSGLFRRLSPGSRASQ